MLSKIGIIVAVLLTLAGLLGLRMKAVRKRLLFVWFPVIGMILLSAAEMNTYGLVGGCFQAIFRLPAAILCLLLLQNICVRNQVTDMEQLDGLGTRMPYTYVLLVVLSMILTGIPLTGTFTGIIYSEIGLLAGGYGVCTYIGLLGNIMGIIIFALLLFPILRRMYFPCENAEKEAVQESVAVSEKEAVQESVAVPEREVVQESVAAPEKKILGASWVIAVLWMVFSLYQQPVLVMVSTFVQKMFS